SIDNALFLVHSGSSRAYHYRGGTLELITLDDASVQLLIEGGTMSSEVAEAPCRRNVVTNALGVPPLANADIHKIEVLDGDVLLLCTDGLTEVVNDAQIASILGEGADPERSCQRLLDRALDEGGPDNVTALVARYSVT